ncbi:NAD-dependent epimerase/dehydratase family protein [Streptomyces radicis]|uniref:NAD-dependent epimerase/dehydratase family protein n=1 Tax=Streptomyces radicis TaxID=1750517 RepID=A0A3A9VY72_9ACTN|nr:NAD-dependent epimerase/dehydratase family protein [Streptomyces radicis]RKN05689.1 NAD-dependent epimerase/dehydratase family protein [Streptomyces radicis]RKN17528.1 NAD-dependent epimerase/dehydratase family protein [Streptomyces radicis]
MTAASESSPDDGRRVVVVGATGNVGSAVVRALAGDPRVTSVVGIARRVPDWSMEKTTWAAVDIGHAGAARDALAAHFAEADAVIHLAWMIQPARDPLTTWRTNVLGTDEVLAAAAASGVPALICASSVGAYAPGPKDRLVDESWPTHGWPTASYTREKAYVERMLDAFELEHPGIRVVRMRPGFLFARHAASGQRRLFLGPLLPAPLVRPGRTPVVPDAPGLRFQVLHTADAAEAYRLAVHRPVRGAFNLTADPVVDPALLADMFGARTVRVPRPLLRAALAAAWGARLAPAAPGLFDALVRLPLMDRTRAEEELGWTPRRDARDALADLVHGLRHRTGLDTPPLRPEPPGGRLAEVATGVGRRA